MTEKLSREDKPETCIAVAAKKHFLHVTRNTSTSDDTYGTVKHPVKQLTVFGI